MVDTVLAAGDVRARLVTALDRVRESCRISAAVWCRLRVVVQAHPLLVQLVRPPEEGRKAQALGQLDASALPADLRPALEAFTAGVLAGLTPSAFEAVVARALALRGRGGFFVFVDPADDLAVLAFSEPGRSLGEAVILGALVDAPEVSH